MPDLPSPDQETGPSLELRKEWTRLRALLYETSDLALSTDERDGHRWLTDRYVLLDVTGSVAVDGKPDGLYKLKQSSKDGEAGLVPKDGVNFLNGGIVDYLTKVEKGARWRTVAPSEWSVAEHPGKAMLLVALDYVEDPFPVLMGESTWTALHRHYGEPIVHYDVESGRNLFRVSIWDKIALRQPVVAYVAGIRIPDGQEKIAKAIAELVDTESTSN